MSYPTYQPAFIDCTCVIFSATLSFTYCLLSRVSTLTARYRRAWHVCPSVQCSLRRNDGIHRQTVALFGRAVNLVMPHPLTQKDQIRHGNTYAEGCVFGRWATPLHLHKCVARFVSDWWVSCLASDEVFNKASCIARQAWYFRHSMGFKIWRVRWPLSFADSSHAGTVERHVQCRRSRVELILSICWNIW